MVAIFTRSITDDLTSLVKQIDEQVAKNEDKKMASFVILLCINLLQWWGRKRHSRR